MMNRHRLAKPRTFDWFRIVEYLESESKSNAVNAKICQSCGFARILDKNGKPHVITRNHSLESAKEVFEKVKQINAASN